MFEGVGASSARATWLVALLLTVGCEHCDCRGAIAGARGVVEQAQEQLGRADRARALEQEPEARRFVASSEALMAWLGGIDAMEVDELAGLPRRVEGTVDGREAEQISYVVRGPQRSATVTILFVRDGETWPARRGEAEGPPGVAWGETELELVLPEGGGDWD